MMHSSNWTAGACRPDTLGSILGSFSWQTREGAGALGIETPECRFPLKNPSVVYVRTVVYEVFRPLWSYGEGGRGNKRSREIIRSLGSHALSLVSIHLSSGGDGHCLTLRAVGVSSSPNGVVQRQAPRGQLGVEKAVISNLE